jgi:hypothetical protein
MTIAPTDTAHAQPGRAAIVHAEAGFENISVVGVLKRVGRLLEKNVCDGP